MNTADPRHYTLPKPNLYIEAEAFNETGASPFLKPLPLLDKVALANKVVPTDKTTRVKAVITSDCRHCRHYHHVGRRGGHCEQLNVPVQGRWDACTLSESAFYDIPQSAIQSFRD